ncbi:MAG: UbiA family prenyltransferase, partial [Bacteroidota bacterium]|nr:UbiA family prenyltransferase [Bacteroidota bacterium]
IYGGAAVGNIKQAMMPAVFALLINVGREVIKDMEDVEGDMKNNIVTYPIKYGMKRASWVATIFLSAVIVSTFIPFLLGFYGIKFFAVVNVGVNAVVVFVIYSLWKDQSSGNLNRVSNILKYDMLVGLVAIYLG